MTAMVEIPARRRAPLLLLALLLLLVAAVGGAGYVAYRLVAGSSDLHARMLPGDSEVFSTLLLDPPASQKVALLHLATRFPNVHNERDTGTRVGQQADAALKSLGLNYHDDVQPWLGSQVSMGGRVGRALAAKEPPDLVVLLASKDDKKALAALDKARAHSSDLKWTKTSHGGVDVWVGRVGNGPSGQPNNNVYAYVDHTVVIGTTDSAVKAVIDADQGKTGRLSESRDFQDVVARLPADHFALGYANVPSLVARLETAIKNTPPATAGIKVSPDQLKPLRAYRSAGFTLRAEGDRVVFDLKGGIDASRLDAPTRQAIDSANHPNSVLSYLPPGVYAAAGTTGLKQAIKQVQQQAAFQATDSSRGNSGAVLPPSITDSNGALGHLGNDLAVEIRPSADLPAGALVVQTDDAASTSNLLQQLIGLAASGAPSVQTYKGVQITSAAAQPSLPVAPAYAVTAGVAIVGTSPAEVRALLDAHASHQDLTGSAEWKDGAKAAPQPQETVLFVDIQRALQAIRQRLPEPDRTRFEDSTRDAAPLRELFISGQSSSGQYAEQVVLVIR